MRYMDSALPLKFGVILAPCTNDRMTSPSSQPGMHHRGASNRRRLRSHPLFHPILLSLMLGVGLSVTSGVVGCVVFWRWSATLATQSPNFSVGSVPGSNARHQLIKQAWFDYILSYGVAADPSATPYPGVVLPSWDDGHARLAIPLEGYRTSIGVGIPFRAFTGCYESFPHVTGGPGVHEFRMRRGSGVGEAPWSWFVSTMPDPVPTHVRTVAFLANWIVWAVVCFPFVSLPTLVRLARASYRRARWECATCGYDLRMISGPRRVCPECGAASECASLIHKPSP